MTMQEKITKRYPVDERISQVNEKRLAVCGVIAIFYVIIRLIYVGFQGELALPELILLFLMAGAMAMVDRKNNIHELPRFLGRPLDPAPSARGKRIGMYLLAAAGLAASWAAMDYICGVVRWDAPIKGVLADTGICVVVFFLFNLIIGESKVRKYNCYMKQAEEEENDLS